VRLGASPFDAVQPNNFASDTVNDRFTLNGDEVVAHGPDGRAVYDAARATGIDSPFMEFVEEPDPTPFVGGWL